GAIEGLVHDQMDKTAVAAFAVDKAMARRIDDWIEQGQMAQLLGLWVKGLDVDWHRLYGEQVPRRLDLPTYPFAIRRFWLPGVWDRGGAPKPVVARPVQPWHEAETAAGGTERPGPKAQLVPPASVVDTGETMVRPKPRGIVLP